MHLTVQFLAGRPVSETDILPFAHANFQLSLTRIKFKTSLIKGLQVCNKQSQNTQQLPDSNLERIDVCALLLDAEKSSVTYLNT